jgi:hypothetical protein
MFGKIVVGKAFAALVAAGVLSGALAMGVVAAPAAATASSPTKQQQHPQRRPHVVGVVKSVDGNVITITTRGKKDVKVTVSATTKFIEGRDKATRTAAALKDIHAGQRLIAVGRRDANGALDAARVLFWDRPATR